MGIVDAVLAAPFVKGLMQDAVEVLLTKETHRI
jgi:hypothetical protein